MPDNASLSDQNVISALRARGLVTPNSVALLSSNGQVLNYQQLLSTLTSTASALAHLGLGRHDVIAIVFDEGVDYFLLAFAIASFAVCAPINPALSDPELHDSLAAIGAKALIVAEEQSAAASIAESLGIPATPAAAILSAQPSRPHIALRSPCVPSDCAFLLQTSATSSSAKLVPITHANLFAMAANTSRILDLHPHDRFLSMMPLFHLQGLLSGLAQLLAGGSVVCTSGFDAHRFNHWLEELRPTWYTAGPALHAAILQTIASQTDRKQTSLRFVRSIGAALPPTLAVQLERTLAVPVLEGYGMTETGMVTSNTPSPDGRKLHSAGRSGGLALRIVDEASNPVPAGQEGEITVRGSAVVRAYLNNGLATEAAFKDGWFHTGDLGFLDQQDFLFVTGRIKDLINRGGEKIVPSQVDAVLSAHPAVSEAAAFALPHPSLGQEIYAAVVLRPNQAMLESALRHFAASRLAYFKVPRRIFFLSELPKGPTGKLNRNSLPALTANFASETVLPVACPHTSTTPPEQKLTHIWKRVLGIDETLPHDDFFLLGGDSFGASLLLMDVEVEYGLKKAQLQELDFFANPTLEGLAKLVSDAQAAHAPQPRTRSPLLALQPHGSRQPFFCFPGADENPYYLRPLARYLGDDQPFLIPQDTRPLHQRGIYTVEQAASRFTSFLRAEHSGSPFVLGGHCYGGILAFEVARQLIDCGEHVALLVLFEAPTPGYPKVLRHWPNYLRQVASVLVRRQNITRLQAASHLAVWKHLLHRQAAVFRRRFLLQAGLRQAVVPLERLEQPNVQAGRSYRPQPLSCRVVHFLANDEAHSTLILDDPRFAWQEFIQGEGEFLIRRTPGVAAGIFKEPHVHHLAAQLSGLFESVNDQKNGPYVAAAKAAKA